MELFAKPIFQGSKEEWNAMKNDEIYVRPDPDGLVDVKCPYCNWINTHNVRGGGGHRGCDGPIQSEWINPKKWKPYDCPGYTLRLE